MKDVVLEYIISTAQKYLKVDCIYLYGSRARGDHKETSDYDIAVSGQGSEENWAKLFLALQENEVTLKKIDLVDITSCEPKLRDQILKEGKIIYEI
jgi:predicted nucleotidyltransferase